MFGFKGGALRKANGGADEARSEIETRSASGAVVCVARSQFLANQERRLIGGLNAVQRNRQGMHDWVFLTSGFRHPLAPAQVVQGCSTSRRDDNPFAGSAEGDPLRQRKYFTPS
jgi:hypothetical protein